jgi:hypothetical protein
MLKKVMLPIGCALLAVAFAAPAGVTLGPTKPLGAGTARAYVKVANGAPVTLGVALSKTALDQLPQNCKSDKTPATSMWVICDGGKMNDAMVTILNTPAPGASTNVKNMELSWLPYGHAPEHVWDKPQFDIHFNYDAPTGGMDESKFYVEPPAQDLPEGYMILPQSGFPWNTPAQKYHSHSADPKTSPEFGGGPFTTNFLYTTYNGKVIGYEPYVTLEYLKSQTTPKVIPVKTPAEYPKTGYYPTAMKVGWDAEMDAYVVALEGFKKYTAPAAKGPAKK